MDGLCIINICWFTLFIITLISDQFDSLDVLYCFSFLTSLTICVYDNNIVPNLLYAIVNPVIMLLACLAIFSLIFQNSKLLEKIISYFNRITNKLKFTNYLLLFSCLSSAFLNNALIVSSMIPLVLKICRKHGWRLEIYLLPLSFSCMLGGTITLIGSSTNLVATSLLEPEISIGMLDLAKYSIPTAIVGIIYLVIFIIHDKSNGEVSSCCLPITKTKQKNIDIGLKFIKVLDHSDIIGKTIREAQIQELFGLQLCGIQRGDTFSAIPPRSFTVIQKDDILTYIGYINENHRDNENIVNRNLVSVNDEDMSNLTKPNIGVGLVPKFLSSITDKKCGKLGFKTKYNLILLGIIRDCQIITKELGEMVIRSNDFIVVHGLFNRNDMENKLSKICTKVHSLSGIDNDQFKNSNYTDTVLVLAFTTIIVSGFIKSLNATLISVIYVFILWLIRSISVEDMKTSLKKYKNILLGTSASLLMTACLDYSKVLITFSEITIYFNSLPKWSLYFIYHLIASVLSIMISNVAVVSILIPIIKIAYLNTDLLIPISYCVIHGASCCFASPTGYHTNLMVHSIGNYKCRDYLKLGIPLHLITSLVFSTSLYLFY